MGSTLASHRARAPQKPDHPAKHKSTKEFNGFLTHANEVR